MSRQLLRPFLASAASLLLLGAGARPAFCQVTSTAAALAAGQTDTDHDGLSDVLEQQLLEQFRPEFRIGAQDCSNRPAEFRSGVVEPKVQAEDGTIYGQAFPVSIPGTGGRVELHFYHLWRRDCGGHGHPLDAEHVSALVAPVSSGTGWKALYWYAAAHEDTVCDVSQISRASAVQAEDQGARVSISPGKHASYLREQLCGGGCGADRCERMVALPAGRVINLGEPQRPMNDALFAASTSWPLLQKMKTSDFPATELARVNDQPGDQVLLFRTGRHPAQGIIAHSASTEQALASAGHNTTSAVGVAGASTGDALSTGGSSTGTALGTAGNATGGALSTAQAATGHALAGSYRHTRHALGTSVRHVTHALGADKDESASDANQKR